MKIELYNSECLEKLKELPDDSIDAVVTDPPYGLSFMGKKWDYDVPSVAIWEECLRVLKPGGYVLAFSSSRTYHRMAVRVEDAGFEIRDQLMWIYGSGFPKSHKLGDGWGTALKPAHEPICMARKPFDGSAEKVFKNTGLGGINIDACRIVNESITINKLEEWSGFGEMKSPQYKSTTSIGRFPANIILDEEAGVILDEQTDSASRFFYCPKVSKKERNAGLEEIEATTDKKKGNGLGRKCSHCGTSMLKPKDCKCETPIWIIPPQKNNHPTVKPIALMEYLIKLVSKEEATILDPFMGSGSTGIAAKGLNRNFIGIEMDEGYYTIASKRIGK